MKKLILLLSASFIGLVSFAQTVTLDSCNFERLYPILVLDTSCSGVK